ncbi:ABC transporter ATP-binding protein [Caproiciproducens faecalis]|uniref:ABC transporter ATP-binding protein n=1 Tax=Caproiciproducens faecalis TaxID=2820301 RepID=A0ABS7DLY8_9FIRM|nr:ABC transporter ATP-binding protein [Caproiciproducens faecalis]
MLNRFFIYFDKYRKHLIGGVICVALEAMFELVIPLIMADIIDVGVVTRDTHYILQKSLAMVACALISLLLGAIYARLAARAGQGFGAELRKAEYRKVQGFSFSNMDHFSTPSLITRLTSDITILQNAICNGIRPMVRGPVMMVMALAMSIKMSPQLAVVFLTAIPVLAICLVLILHKLRPMYGKMQKALDRVNSIVQENLTAIRTVKSYVKGDSECMKFSAVNDTFRASSEMAFHYAALNMPCFQFVMYATILCILWFGGNFIHVGTMQVGQLTGFLSYVLQILNSLMMISNVFLMLSRSMTSAYRISEVLDEPVGITDGTGSRTVEHGSIDFEHVSFKYQETAKEFVLSDISLHIGAGQMVGIIGGTGSAKSSLVQLIPRLYDVTAGCLKIDGHDVKEYPLAPLRDAVGMVLQKNTLFTGTIRENLKWGNENATDEELDWACRIACADEFLSRMPEGYDTDLGQGGVNVSGGQKQRLCIARALLKRPKVLIFDDSTSAVDTATEAKIRRRLAENLKDTTKIIITQRISSIENADLIVVLEDGKINEAGTHEELLAHNPIYRDIYEFQQKGATA